MRAVTPTLAAAIEAAERIVRLDARIDWDDDGYNTLDYSDPFNRTNTITFVGAGTNGLGNNVAVTPTFHANTVPGDTVLIHASIRNSGTGTVDQPAGWSTLVSFGNEAIFARVIQAGDLFAQAVTFTGGATNADTIAQAATFRGVAAVSALAASATQLNASAQDIAYPALTVPSNGCAVIIAAWKQDDATAVAVPAGYAGINSSFVTAGDDALQTWRYQIQTTATNVPAGTLTITGGAAAISRAIVLALKPITGWDNNPTGLLYAYAGVGGTPAIADYATTGAAATISVTPTSGYRIAYLGNAILDVADTDAVVEWTSPAPTGANLEPGAALLRVQDASNYLLCQVILVPGGAVQIAIVRLLAGTELSLRAAITIPGLTYTAAVPWITHAQAVGNRIRMTVYPSTAAEPVTWQATVYDTTWTSGGFGIRAGRSAGNTNTSPVVFGVNGFVVAASAEDDISDKLTSLSITRDMRGQLPDEVLVVEGISAATADGDLTAGGTADETLNTVRYFSRTNPASPIYGKPRDSRDARINVEFLTDNGFEQAPRMTNAVLRALPVNAGARTAHIELIDGRDRFRLPITLPAVIADGPWDGTGTIPTKPGLEASWIVSYVLAQCGYPLSPRPRAECRLHIPMHGSLTPFVQTPFSGAPRAKWEPDPNASDPRRVPYSSDAPFFLATAPQGGYIQAKAPVNAVPTDGWNSVGRATGIRVELWIKRSGTEPAVDAAVVEVYNDTFLTQSRVKFFARTDGTLAVQVINGADSYFQFSTLSYSANVWHLVGVHVDDAGGSIDFRVDGTGSSHSHAATTAGVLNDAPVFCDVKAYSPTAELHVSMCTRNTAWLPTLHDSGAVVDRLQNRAMSGIYPDKPIAAWDLLQQVTAAELGTCWIDYDGRPNVWSAARRNSPDSLTVQRTVDSRRHLMDLGYDDTRDMIRNLIRVPYTQYATAGLVPIWSLTELVSLVPGETKTFAVKWKEPLAGSITTVTGQASTAASSPTLVYVYHNLGPNGIRVSATLTSPTTATLTLVNFVGVTLWLVDGSGVPDLILNGTPISKVDTDPVQVQDDTAIARRGGPGIGEAPLDVDDNVWRQSAAFARGTGLQLLATLRDEQIVFTDIRIPGDPRLEPLDRIRVQDPDGLVLDTPLLIEAVGDTFEAGSYDVSLVGRPARDQHLWGGPGVGTPIGSTIIGGTP